MRGKYGFSSSNVVKSSHYPPVSPSSPFRAALYSLRPVGLSLRDVVGQLAVPRFFASHPLLRRKHQQGSNDC